ncbi:MULTISPECIES: TonB-dependent receptor [unclassified Novosphingobium]|uniref:TonB-dependent receptor n=1 Tax=unclassified Novosphingobium TaxID=2644732 RepID=UPI00135A8A6F|nr:MULTISPECIES: TonB-dependent receptor [unclassified Novosphingobium]
MHKYRLLAATAASVAVACALGSAPALAQSTGSLDFENSEIVVTGQVQNGVAGVQLPNTPKAKQVLTQEVIGRETPGQSVDDMINLIPGVSFQSNDGYGSSGGTLMIRGFDDSRISQTFDGIPLNDTGNYAIYSNQMLDPELIHNVNVNLGTTDVDSPTASASGSTVNIRSIDPDHEFGARMVGTLGDYNKMRIFGMINTGDLNSSGTRAWFSGSKDTYDVAYGGIGKIDKTQFNAKIYQPLGNNGDFISLAGHYNVNHNNYFPSVRLVTDAAVGNTGVNSSSSGRFPLSKDERDDYSLSPCGVSAGVNGHADAADSCGTSWEWRYNPSRTWNIRMNSKFTLNDRLTLTVDPYLQYTNANGGGTVSAKEGSSSTGLTGYIGGTPYFGGVDLNGDGDTLDTVTLSAPSQTETWRMGVLASLIYDISDTQRFRVSYAWDRGRHRQTGELGYLAANGMAASYFNNDDPLSDVDGNVLQKRDRLSYAILHQVSGEYAGEFGSLHVNAGLALKYFKRNLTQNCLTTSASGSVSCFGSNSADEAAYAATLTTYAGPVNKTFSWTRALPNIGVTYDFTPAVSLFANYSKGIQVPGTDNLYNSFYFDGANAAKPETTDNFDLGLRYQSGILQGSLGGWYTNFADRLSSAYDPDSQTSIYTNLGKVERYGIDASLAVKPDSHFSAYVFYSYLWSKIKDDIAGGVCGSSTNAVTGTLNPIGASGCSVAGDTYYYSTKGNMEGAVPHYTLGGRITGEFGPLSVGVEAKRTGARYYNDSNSAVYSSAGVELFGAKVPAYTLVNLDARLNAEFLGLGKKTYLQFNVTNLFDKFYVGGFDDAGINPTSTIYAYIGAPRTMSGSINMQF